MPASGTAKAIMLKGDLKNKINSEANIKERFKIIGENADGMNLPDACNTAPQIARRDIIGK